MKKTLAVLAAMAVSGIASAITPITLFDFNSSWITGDTATSAEKTQDGVTATITPVGTGTSIAAGTTTYTLSDDKTKMTGALTSTLNSNVNMTNAFTNDVAQTYIKGSAISTSITLTLSGLEANTYYNISLVTGLDKEMSGAWNSITLASENVVTKTASTPTFGTQSIAAAQLTGYAITDAISNAEGKITLTVNSNYNKDNGGHSATLNALAIATPEPATATLSLLALAGLAARRRRR